MTPRCVIALALAAGALAAAGCGDDRPLGGGLDVGFCDAQTELDALPEPRPANQGEAVRYAEGALRIYGRVDLRLDAGRKKLPQAKVRKELGTIRLAMQAYRDETRKAKAGPALTAAFTKLADGPYGPASDRLADIARKECV